MCDGKELIKQDGVFVCQSCNSKYSVEEAKKIMVEVEDSAKLNTKLETIRSSTEVTKTPEKEKPIFADLEPKKEKSRTNLQSGNSRSYQSQPQPKSQVIAFILCFFCGLFGFHRFYVGKIGTGILMLLMGPIVIFGMYVKDMAEMATIFETGRELSQTGDTIVTISAFLALILCIWVLIDLIRILTGSFTKNSEPIKTKNKDYTIITLGVIILAVFIFIIYFKDNIPKSLGMSAKAKAQEVVPAASTWIKLQEAYYMEVGKFGDCLETGYSMPGGGRTENFTYRCGIERGTAYFIAKNNENLGECSSGNSWTLFMRRRSNSIEPEVQLPENQNCQELTPDFSKLEELKISGLKAEKSKKTSGVRLAPEQPQETLNLQGVSRMEIQKLGK
jgi:hypothetical protein